MDGLPLVKAPWFPQLSTLARVTRPDAPAHTKVSPTPLVSPLTRSEAELVNAT